MKNISLKYRKGGHHADRYCKPFQVEISLQACFSLLKKSFVICYLSPTALSDKYINTIALWHMPSLKKDKIFLINKNLPVTNLFHSYLGVRKLKILLSRRSNMRSEEERNNLM